MHCKFQSLWWHLQIVCFVQQTVQNSKNTVYSTYSVIKHITQSHSHKLEQNIWHLPKSTDFNASNRCRLVFCQSHNRLRPDVLHHYSTCSLLLFPLRPMGRSWQLSRRDVLWQAWWTVGLSVCMCLVERDGSTDNRWTCFLSPGFLTQDLGDKKKIQERKKTKYFTTNI